MALALQNVDPGWRLLGYQTSVASFWIRLVFCAATFVAFGALFIHGPIGASRIETKIAAQANERLRESGIAWAAARADGRTIILSGDAPQPDAAALAAETARGRRFVSGVAAVDRSGLTIAPQAIPVELYEFAASLEPARLVVSGMAPSEKAFDRLTETFEARPEFEIIRRFKLENVESAASWLDAAAIGMHALSLLERGDLKQSAFMFELSGVAEDQASADAVASVIAGAGGPFGFKLSIEKPFLAAAAAEQARACQASINKALNGRPLTFISGSANLSRSDRALLGRLADGLAVCADLNVVIEGHADATGDENDNQRLSEQRAAAVRAYLIDAGAPATFTTRAFGSSRPIASNRSAQGQRRNRRIDFTVEQNQKEPE